MRNRLNQVRVAGRRLRWSNDYGNLDGDRSWALENEFERPLYFVSKVNGRKAGRRGSFEVKQASNKKILGRKKTIREAKELAQAHFAKGHGGKFEGHWTSSMHTYRLMRDLEKRIRSTPKTDQYPCFVPASCPFCGFKKVVIVRPPSTMMFEHQMMTCPHCGERVYVNRDYSSAGRSY